LILLTFDCRTDKDKDQTIGIMT